MPKIKVTEQQVREIRANREGLSDTKRAKKYGIHRNTVWLIRNYAMRNKG